MTAEARNFIIAAFLAMAVLAYLGGHALGSL
jgi:hypothetical protein